MSNHPTDLHETSGVEVVLLGTGFSVPFAPCVHYSVPDNLLEKAWVDSLTFSITTVPRFFVVPNQDDKEAASLSETAAQRMAAELRRLSGLTNEEIAPLLGVSRRSFQAWIAGRPISARKEARLRDVVCAVRQLAADTPAATRERLLNRPPRSVSAYDLLAEERYEAAVDLATGCRRHQLAPEPAASESIASQLDRIEDNVAPSPRLNRKLSGPLRR
jgi:hypothetical protein